MGLLKDADYSKNLDFSENPFGGIPWIIPTLKTIKSMSDPSVLAGMYIYCKNKVVMLAKYLATTIM